MKTDKTTKETRRASYDAVLPKVKERCRLILATMGEREMTVSEITDELVASGTIPYYNRNFVAPRLTELKDMGVVETCGRRKSTRSNATEAIWRKKQEGNNNMLKKGDKVKMNNKYHVSEEKREKVWTVCSEPWTVCGQLVVKLEGMAGGYAVDGLDLVKE